MLCGAAGLDIFKRINTCVSGAGGVSLCRSAERRLVMVRRFLASV